MHRRRRRFERWLDGRGPGIRSTGAIDRRTSRPAFARNLGAKAAQGEILFFVDSDVCVQPDTLSRIGAEFIMNPDVDAVMDRMIAGRRRRISCLSTGI